MSSLVVTAHLHGTNNMDGRGLVVGHTHGSISEIGFSDSTAGPLFGQPPRPDPLPYAGAQFMMDTFLHVTRAQRAGALGTAKLAEALVEDTYMRGPIDYTGLSLTLLLRDDAYQAYVDYVGRHPRSPAEDRIWSGGIRFRIPSRPFRFPEPRGSDKPWDSGPSAVGRLRKIRTFAFDELEVEALDRRAPGAPGILRLETPRPALRLPAFLRPPRP